MRKRQNCSLLGFAQHDHKRCVSAGLKVADVYCQKHKLRLTTVRRRTLSILLESHTALGAYDVLARLREEGLGSEPPVAYRALGFLLENGFIHRIERLNAYVACSHPGALHNPAFLICSDCRAVAESTVATTTGTLNRQARESGFQIEHTTIEAEGQCPSCQQANQ